MTMIVNYNDFKKDSPRLRYLTKSPLIRIRISLEKYKHNVKINDNCVYFYRGWLRHPDDMGLGSCWKIGYSKSMKTRMEGLIRETSLKFDYYDDWPVFVIDGLSKSEAVAIETEIHDFIIGASGGKPFRFNEDYNDTGLRLPGTKEWFTVLDKHIGYIVVFFACKHNKNIIKFNPYTIINDDGLILFDL